MKLPDLSFTKRLSVRLGALGTFAASAAIGVAQSYWKDSGSSAEPTPAPAVAPSNEPIPEPLVPIRDELAAREVPGAAGDLRFPAPAEPQVAEDPLVQPAAAFETLPSPRGFAPTPPTDGGLDPPAAQPAAPPAYDRSTSIYGAPTPPPSLEAPGSQAIPAPSAADELTLPSLPPDRRRFSPAPGEPGSADGSDFPAAVRPTATFPDPNAAASALAAPAVNESATAPLLSAVAPAAGANSGPSEASPATAESAIAWAPPGPGFGAAEELPSPASSPSLDLAPSLSAPPVIAAAPSTFRSEPPAAIAAPAATELEAPRTLGVPESASLAPLPSRLAAQEPSADVQTTSLETNVTGDGVPGAAQLDGAQSPSLTIERIAPDEVQVGREAAFRTRIRNIGAVAAQDVVVLDRVPRGMSLVNTSPEAQIAPDGQLMWQLGNLSPGDEIEVMVRLMPVTEGELGSVAQVLFATPASVRTICTRPQLAVNHTGPAKVLIGETVTLDITVANPGTGAAASVVLEEDVPEGLAHERGRELEFDVGTLQPGDVRHLQLTLRADQPGTVEHQLLARGEGSLEARDTIRLEVIAPDLAVTASGPKLRYLNRPATFEVTVSNPGTATARDVELVTYLPKGMKFVEADQKGQYEPQNHAVYWSLAELPANQSGAAKLTVLPVETGPQRMNIEGRAALGLQATHEKTVTVESLAELQFAVADEADPIEIGAETTYTITLSNSGSSSATGIQLAVVLPAGMQALGGDGPTTVRVDGGQVAIDPLARLGAGETAVYRLKAVGNQEGPQRIQVQLVTAETPVPVAKEEITRVYADR